MERSQLEIEFLTPCFLGGADPAKKAEWRAASVRGQLRWWLRAVVGGRFGGDLERVREMETAWLGRTDRRSPVRVSTLGRPAQVTEENPRWGRSLSPEELARAWNLNPHQNGWYEALERLRGPHTNPLLYLGYGCLANTRSGIRMKRACLAPGAKGAIRLQLRRFAGQSSDESLWRHVVWAWLHLGGIGSRSRRGFGAMQLIRAEGLLDGWEVATREEFAAQVKALLDFSGRGEETADLPGWSHFSPRARVYLGAEPAADWAGALVRAGAWLMAFRRRYGMPRDERESLRNRDYSWAKTAAEPTSREHIPDRAGFGLPLPFGKQIVTWGEHGADNRRASPLLISVARLDRRYFPVLTYLPAQLVPKGETLRFKGLHRPLAAPTAEQENIVGAFLSDLEQKSLIGRIQS